MTNLPADGKVFPSSKNATENPTRHSEEVSNLYLETSSYRTALTELSKISIQWWKEEERCMVSQSKYPLFILMI